MRDDEKSKQQLIAELESLRNHIARMEARSAVIPEAGDRLDATDTQLVSFVFDQIFGRIPICINRFDREGVVTLSLGAGLQRFGYDRNQLVGINMLEAYEPSRAPFERAVNGETVIYRSEGEFPDGSIWAFQNFMMPDASNPEGGCINVSMDISEQVIAERKQRALETQMQHTQKLESLGVLAGGIAHDFNNLLTAILGNAELAQMELPTSSPARCFITSISAAAVRAADLCKQMLAYAGKGRYMVDTYDLNKLVSEINRLARVSLGKKVQLQWELAERPCRLAGDPVQIRQVIMNLMTNASEAIGDQVGQVTVSTGSFQATQRYLDATHISAEYHLKPGPYTFLQISDSGCGIPKEHLDKIFDPFFTTKFMGRGLGLAAVMGIVRGHGGGLAVHSQPGMGTTIRILFPQVEAEQEESPSAKSGSDAFWRGSGKVLLIDDEAPVREVGRLMLERLGFQVETADGGNEGLAKLGEQGKDLVLVLLDLTMPDLSGEETFLQLRKQYEDLPVLLCSGYSEKELSERFEKLGFAGFLQKPFTSDTMRERLRLALN